MSDENNFLTKRTKPLTPKECKVVEDNQGLIGDVIRRQFHGYLGKSTRGELPVSYRDLFEAGVFGLVEAIDRWIPEKAAFSTFAEWWIKNKIFRWLREHGYLIHIPKWVLQAKGLDPETIAKDLAEGTIDINEAKKRERDRRRLERARQLKPVNEALDHHYEADTEIRDRHRQILLRLIYSIQIVSEDEATGRVTMMKMVGLDGGTPAMTKGDEAFDEIAKALGLTPQKTRRNYETFLKKVQQFVQERGMLCPLDLPND